MCVSVLSCGIRVVFAYNYYTLQVAVLAPLALLLVLEAC